MVRVQLLEEEMGRPFKPNDRGPEWHATTKGDARLFVLALTILPEEGTAKKPIKVSLQLRARAKELKVVADKDTLKRYAANFVMLFGKADQVNINKTAGSEGVHCLRFLYIFDILIEVSTFAESRGKKRERERESAKEFLGKA